MDSLRNHVICIWGLAVITVVVAIVGLFVVESPLTSRKIRSDEIRVKHSQDIINAISTFNTVNSKLPAKLSDLEETSSITDPDTQKGYSYRIIAPGLYELCMTFETEAGEISFDFDSPTDPFVIHKLGSVCANIPVESNQPVPMQDSQSQAEFLNLKADLHINYLGEKSAVFEFQQDNENAYYTVDVSTDPQFNENIYLEFARGSSLPLTTSTIDYYDFTCGTTLYWRVSSDQSVRSGIQESVVTCEN